MRKRKLGVEIILSLIFFLSMTIVSLGQGEFVQKDSLRAIEILQKANIETSAEGALLNPNGLTLSLTEKEFLIILKVILFSTYGKREICKQKPFHLFKKRQFWIAWGNPKENKRGGVFEIVVNAENLCVEYLSHGK